MTRRFSVRAIVYLILCSSLAGCASLTGYPSDPAGNQSDIDSFRSGFGSDIIVEYTAATDAGSRKSYRDRIVLERLVAYDSSFKSFERNLSSQTNYINTAGDLAVLGLSAASTVAASAATKTVLSAAAIGVQGAGGKINKDLFYQAALPAMLTQMEANRATVLADIIKGTAETDAQYPLAMALHDIDRYANAGSIPSALSVITKAATDTKAAAEADISSLRVQSYKDNAPTTGKLVNWLFPGGDRLKDPIPANLSALTNWMQKDTVDPKLSQLPYEMLLNGNDASMEPDRARAVAALLPNGGK